MDPRTQVTHEDYRWNHKEGKVPLQKKKKKVRASDGEINPKLNSQTTKNKTQHSDCMHFY